MCKQGFEKEIVHVTPLSGHQRLAGGKGKILWRCVSATNTSTFSVRERALETENLLNEKLGKLYQTIACWVRKTQEVLARIVNGKKLKCMRPFCPSLSLFWMLSSHYKQTAIRNFFYSYFSLPCAVKGSGIISRREVAILVKKMYWQGSTERRD